MPIPTTTSEFAEIVRKSRLVGPDELDAYLADHAGGAGVTPTELARGMIDAGLITAFQSEQLLRGKHRGYFLGKYKLLERIGMGGMGQVFLAEHVSMHRRVALKVLPPELSTNEYTRERFLREARAAGQLNHPNLVRAMDVDGEGEVLYLVMEYIDGVTLHDLVERHGPLDPYRAANYLWQAANGLAHINNHGLVHRDVKPANVLVDRLGVVKILDLGLVRSQVEDDDLTRGQGVKILGTADYLAPEQAIDCSTVDIRADLYALGATGYFLLTGQPPFPADKMAQKLLAHQTMPVPQSHAENPAVPEELSAILTRLMAKSADDRYATPEDVMADLEPWAAVPPPPPSDVELPPRRELVARRATAGSGSGSIQGGSAVNLSAVGSGSSAVRLRAVPPDIRASRSAHSDHSRPGLPAPAARPSPLTPVPGPPANTPPPVGRLDRNADRPSAQAPPLLPATRTHTHAESNASLSVRDSFRVEPRRPANPTAASGPGPIRRFTSMALAVVLLVVLSAWNVTAFAGRDPGAIASGWVGSITDPAPAATAPAATGPR